MKDFSVLCGALNYEFRMQIRRRAVWITMILLSLLLVGLYSRAPQLAEHIASIVTGNSLLTVLAYWTFTLNRLLPIGVGVLQADRLPRDRRTRVDELFTSLPAPLSARLIGKYLGSMLATLIPILLFYAIGVGYIVALTGNVAAIPLALESFAVIVLPGIMFISAFSLACPALLWVPLYQFCFVGYWFWGNMLGPRQGIPTLSQTILTPVGGYMAKGFYHIDAGPFSATPLRGIESMALLIALAVFMLFVLWSLLKWQQERA
jgi:ABC-2 type transport system permease protein